MSRSRLKKYLTPQYVLIVTLILLVFSLIGLLLLDPVFAAKPQKISYSASSESGPSRARSFVLSGRRGHCLSALLSERWVCSQSHPA